MKNSEEMNARVAIPVAPMRKTKKNIILVGRIWDQARSISALSIPAKRRDLISIIDLANVYHKRQVDLWNNYGDIDGAELSRPFFDEESGEVKYYAHRRGPKNVLTLIRYLVANENHLTLQQARNFVDGFSQPKNTTQ